MTRSYIAVAVVLLAILAPSASARIIDQVPNTAEAKKGAHYVVQPERITDTGGRPLVMPERITDHRADAPTSSLAGTTGETARALAQEQYYKSQSDALASLVREQESVSRAGNQGVPRPDQDDTPWAIIAVGLAGTAVLAAGLTVMARRTRTRVAA
jgi:hypothetical protein